jgi:hypothetical protein
MKISCTRCLLTVNETISALKSGAQLRTADGFRWLVDSGGNNYYVKIAGCNRLAFQVSRAAFDWLLMRELIKHVQTTKSGCSTWIADGYARATEGRERFHGNLVRS